MKTRDDKRVRKLEAALIDAHRASGGETPPAGFASRVMAAVEQTAPAPGAIAFPDYAGDLWSFARVAAVAAVLALIVGYNQLYLDDAWSWSVAADPFGVTSFVLGL